MEHINILDDAVYFLLTAIVVISVSNSLRLSTVIGYLVAGILLGPHGFQIITHVDGSRSLAEFGLVFLFFAIGLELPVARLLKLAKFLFGLGFIQVAATGAGLYGVFLWLGLTVKTSLVLACGLSLSSTAVVLQVLSDGNEVFSKHGRISFSVLLFQDLVAVLMLVGVSALGSQEAFSQEQLLSDSFKAFLGLFVMVVLGRYLIPLLYKLVGEKSQPDLFMAFTLFVILGVSMLAEKSKISMELGAFITGFLLAETDFRHKVEVEIRSFRGILLGLFFTGIGMKLDINIIKQNFHYIAAFLAIYIPAKFVLIYILTRLFRISHAPSMRISALLAPAGEFAFVILGPAMVTGILNPFWGQLSMAVAALSMLFTPFMYKLAKRWHPVTEAELEMAAQMEKEKVAS